MCSRAEQIKQSADQVTPDDNDTCKDVTIEAAPVEVTKTCRAGGWWNEKACRIGPVEIGKVTAKYFACAEGEGTSSERSCHDRLRKARILRLDRAMLLRQGILRRLRYRHRRDLGRRTRDLLGRVHLHRRHDRNGQVQ